LLPGTFISHFKGLYSLGAEERWTIRPSIKVPAISLDTHAQGYKFGGPAKFDKVLIAVPDCGAL